MLASSGSGSSNAVESVRPGEILPAQNRRGFFQQLALLFGVGITKPTLKVRPVHRQVIVNDPPKNYSNLGMGDFVPGRFVVPQSFPLSRVVEEVNRTERILQRNIEEYRARMLGEGPQNYSWSGDIVRIEAGKSTEAK